MKIIHHRVPETTLRFDRYCSEHFAMLGSLKRSKKWIKDGHILLNQRKAETGRFLKNGDLITIKIPQSILEPWNAKLPVLYEDDFLAVVDKPPGMMVHSNEQKSLRNALLYALQTSSQADALVQPEPVHRLDRRTQGLILVAKTDGARKALAQMLEAHQIRKQYECLVVGKAVNGESHLLLDGKVAYSSWQVLKVTPSHFTGWISHLSVEIQTGRQHQIRRHLLDAGVPVLGDEMYCIGTPLRSKGLFLCSTLLQFEHPMTHQELHVQLPTPTKFEKRWEYEQKMIEKSHSQP